MALQFFENEYSILIIIFNEYKSSLKTIFILNRFFNFNNSHENFPSKNLFIIDIHVYNIYFYKLNLQKNTKKITNASTLVIKVLINQAATGNRPSRPSMRTRSQQNSRQESGSQGSDRSPLTQTAPGSAAIPHEGFARPSAETPGDRPGY